MTCFPFLFFLLDIFFIYIQMLSHESPYPPSPAQLPYPPTPTSRPWHSPVLGHIKFARLRDFSSQWWPSRPSSATYAARDTSSGVLVSSYCCSNYRVADPFSSLGAFSSSSIGGPVFQGNSYEGKHLMGLAYSFRGSVHYHHGWKHGSMQADLVLEELEFYILLCR
jgi:hypothetical protein